MHLYWNMLFSSFTPQRQRLWPNSHTAGFSQCFYTAFSVISRLLSIFSLHSTTKSGIKHEIHQSLSNHRFIFFLRTLSQTMSNVSDLLKICAILCKRKDAKGVEESQEADMNPIEHIRSKVADLDHVKYSNPVRAAPGRGCNPTVQDSWQNHCQELDSATSGLLKRSQIFMKEKKKKFTHVQQVDAALTNDWRQWQCDNIHCYFMLKHENILKSLGRTYRIHLHLQCGLRTLKIETW